MRISASTSTVVLFRPFKKAPAQPANPCSQAATVLTALVVLVVVSRATSLVPHDPALQTWAAVFVAIVVQSLPFLLLGVLLASAISTLISEELISRFFPKNAVEYLVS